MRTCTVYAFRIRNMKATLLVAFLMLISCSCFAQFDGDSNQLLRECKAEIRLLDGQSTSAGESLQASDCAGFVRGAVDAYMIMKSLDPKSVDICTQDNVTVGELIRVVSRYMDEHPQQLHFPAAVTIYNAMHTAFPCNKK